VHAVAAGGGTEVAPLLPDGRFELTGLGEAEYTLFARSDAGGFALRGGVAAGAEDVTLVLRRGGRIELKLVEPDGAPVTGAAASVFRVDGIASPGIVTTATSDVRGLARIVSPAGAVEVRVARVDGPVMTASGSATLVVEEGSTITAEVVLTPPAALDR